MYNFYNTIPEKRTTGRNAHEITLAAREHEKRRFQIMQAYAALTKPRVQVERDRQSGWTAIFKAPLRLLASLIG